MIICYLALAIGLIYLAVVGWYLTVVDILLTIVDVFLLVLFGTALSSIIGFFFKSNGTVVDLTSIVSSIYGFVCGAYMPISQFSVGIQKFILCLPGTYGTGLLRNHLLQGTIDAMGEMFPSEVTKGIADSFDMNLYFFGNSVKVPMMYVVLIVTIIILAGVFILLNVLRKKKTK